MKSATCDDGPQAFRNFQGAAKSIAAVSRADSLTTPQEYQPSRHGTHGYAEVAQEDRSEIRAVQTG
jgi:hypothetical protein